MMPVAARVFELKIIPQLSKIASNFEKKACDRMCFWNTLLLDPKKENSPTYGDFENFVPKPQLDIKFLNP